MQGAPSPASAANSACLAMRLPSLAMREVEAPSLHLTRRAQDAGAQSRKQLQMHISVRRSQRQQYSVMALDNEKPSFRYNGVILYGVVLAPGCQELCQG